MKIQPDHLNHLEDVVPEWHYIARLIFEPVSEDEYRLRAPANSHRLSDAIERIE